MTKRNDIANRVSLSSLLACLILLVLSPAAHADTATDQRAYELVSPANAGGPVITRPLNDFAGTNFGGLTSGGNLYPQLASPLDVKAAGSVVFWESTATPPGTGAIQDGQSVNTFRSVRTPSGWTNQDLTPFRSPSGAEEDKRLVGASADGSTTLIATPLALTPAAFADPQQAIGDPTEASYLYRVTAGGSPPQIISGEQLIPEKDGLPGKGEGSLFSALSASADLSEVAFTSGIPLEASDTCNGGPGLATVYLYNDAIGLAHPIVNFNGVACTAPNVNGALAILPDGRIILQPNPPNPPGGSGGGPLVENNSFLLAPGSVTPLTGPTAATFLSVSPDGSTAYVQSQDALDSRFPEATSKNDIYAMTTASGTEGPVTCISCSSSANGPDQTNVTYITTSQDGAHVLFTTDQGLWEWDASAGAQLLTPVTTPVTDFGPQTVVVSENGQYVIGITSQALSPKDENTGQDIYEFSAGRLPTLITSGTSADTYSLFTAGSGGSFGSSHVAGGVSNDGLRVVYNDSPAGGVPEVIDEWVAGQTRQISPLGSHNAYSVAAVSGAELQDVFFLASDPLVPQDANAGAPDVYDARIDGGFPAPLPPVNENQTANPTGPPIPAYTGNLTVPSFQLLPLSADTSHPATPSALKPLTRAQKLAKALKACKKDKIRSRRTKCETEARKKYATQAKKKK